MRLRSKLILAALSVIPFCQSCIKNVDVLPPPVHIPIPQIEQTPFKTYLDSIYHLEDSLGSAFQLPISAVSLYNPFYPKQEIPGQEIVGYSFRSSVAGKVTSLGTCLPTSGFSHHMMLWDSITLQILAQADVPSLSGGKFTYVSLALVNQAVDIQPNHPYIVTFNSLANGNALNTQSHGNDIYMLFGIYQFFGGGTSSLTRVIPFTKGAITYESEYLLPYNNILSPVSFTEGQIIQLGDSTPGLCDIGFTPN